MASLSSAVAWVKQHPYITSAAVFGVGAVIIYLYYSGSGSSAPAQGASTADPYAAEEQAQLQQEALQAQLAAQVSSQQTAAQIASTQYGDQLAAVQSTNATNLGVATLNAQTTQAGISAQQAIQQQGIAAQVQLGTVSAAENEYVATEENSAAWNQAFAGLYNTYLQAGSPTAVATANLINKINPNGTTAAT
jgi:hypothetical protein